MVAVMWLLYKKSFRDHLTTNLGFGADNAKRITAKAKSRYKSIIGKLPDFEKRDRFQTNIVNCALLIAFLLKDMGYEEVKIIYTTNGVFMSRFEALWMELSGSTLLVGSKVYDKE